MEVILRFYVVLGNVAEQVVHISPSNRHESLREILTIFLCGYARLGPATLRSATKQRGLQPFAMLYFLCLVQNQLLQTTLYYD